MQRKPSFALALGIPLAMTGASATASDNNKPQLNEITVTATRSERRIDDVPNTVTVITAQQAEQRGARDIKDLFRDEIDISVRKAPTRFSVGSGTGRAGVESINIRGLEGNQVLMLIDNIRVPNQFSFGPFATGRGDYVDINGLKSAEILRGPASIQFGSDGLAGAVSFRTLDPDDLLLASAHAGFVRSSYASVDHSWTQTLAAAGQHGKWQGLVLGSLRDGAELDNQGSKNSQDVDRTTPNPVDYDSNYWLGKAQLHINPAHQLGLTAETQHQSQQTEVYSARAKAPLAGSSTIDLDTRDTLERDRVSLQHQYDSDNDSWLQQAQTQLYWQHAVISQFAAEDRNTSADRTRDNTHDTKIIGLSSVLHSQFDGAIKQHLSYGIDWSQSDLSSERSGTVPPPGESFPSKPFPDTRHTLAGLFLQSEITLGDVELIPGLRFDRYQLEPSAQGYSGTIAELSDDALTPRLGAVWHLQPTLTPYAQWSKGFRAPTPEQVNNGFTNAAFGYRSIGNPDLQAERANSVELGLRGTVNTWRYSLATFDNRYQDFISQQVVGGSGTPADPTIFQYINLGEARIRGVELRSQWQVNNEWSATGGIAHAKGDSTVNGTTTPIDSINPLKVVLGTRYDAHTWGHHIDISYNKGKEKDRIAPAASTPFAPGSATIVDIGMYWKPVTQLSLNANLNNLVDKKYWRWSDVRGLADNSTIKDAYSATGRNVQISLRYDF